MANSIKHAFANLLMTDIGMAMTFLDIASTSSEPETIARNKANALED